MADFDERSGIVACPTPWGFWYQTLDEISIEISVAPETRSSQVHVQLRENQLFVTINGDKLIQVGTKMVGACSPYTISKNTPQTS